MALNVSQEINTHLIHDLQLVCESYMLCVRSGTSWKIRNFMEDSKFQHLVLASYPGIGWNLCVTDVVFQHNWNGKEVRAQQCFCHLGQVSFAAQIFSLLGMFCFCFIILLGKCQQYILNLYRVCFRGRGRWLVRVLCFIVCLLGFFNSLPFRFLLNKTPLS